MSLARYNPEVVEDDGKDVFAEMILTPDGTWVRYDDMLLRSVLYASALSQAADGLTQDWHVNKRKALAKHIDALLSEDAMKRPTRDTFTPEEDRQLRRFMYRVLVLIGASIILGIVIGWHIWGAR